MRARQRERKMRAHRLEIHVHDALVVQDDHAAGHLHNARARARTHGHECTRAHDHTRCETCHRHNHNHRSAAHFTRTHNARLHAGTQPGSSEPIRVLMHCALLPGSSCACGNCVTTTAATPTTATTTNCCCRRRNDALGKGSSRHPGCQGRRPRW